MSEPWGRLVADWSEAGVIDAETAARIRQFEEGRVRAGRWRWPMWFALAFGAMMLGAGVLLFVAAHWDDLSPGGRFLTVLSSVAFFHGVAALVSARHPALSTTFHAVGTIALGAGIFLSGQIFNMAEHWPGGVMLWAAGAALAWAVLRDWPQLMFVALLTPFWLVSEFGVAAGDATQLSARVITSGLLLLSLTYLSAVVSHPARAGRRVLRWIGALTLAPCALTIAFAPLENVSGGADTTSSFLPIVGWTVAIGAPLAVAFLLRGAQSWINVVAALWILTLIGLQAAGNWLPLYAWWAVGAAGLVAWGVRESASERINFGAAIMAATVLTFYFSEVMTKLGRSASLIGLGLVFLAGGWALERSRRHFVRQSKES